MYSICYIQTKQEIDKENNVMMNNLNPKESGKKDVFRQLFPPDKEAFYKNLQSNEFNKFLVYDATTSEGRNDSQIFWS